MEDHTDSIYVSFLGEQGQSMMGIPGQEMIDMLDQENGNARFAEYVNLELGHKATTILLKVTLDTYGEQVDGPRYKYMCSR
jgi:hypothetical protein